MRTLSVAFLCFTLLSLSSASAGPIGAAFTYQGKLAESGLPANGSYDLKLTLFDAAGAGNAVSGPITNRAVTVSDCLFTTTLDFGDDVFSGELRWLEIGVRTNGSGPFSTLSPRQLITPTPYALFAPSAGVATSATTATATPWAGLTGLPAGFSDGLDNDTTYMAGTGLSLGGTTFSLNTSYTDGRYWKLGGNSGTTPGTHFLGTADNQPLDLKVNGERGLRLELGSSNSVHVIGGWSGNTVSPDVVGATIAGGGAGLYGGIDFVNQAEADFASIGGGGNNVIQSGAAAATIGGGVAGLVETGARRATIAGGGGNIVRSTARYSTICGGQQNQVDTNALFATISGGYINVVNTNAQSATIGGGMLNQIDDNGQYATIPGGYLNRATNYAFAAGNRARASHTGAFVWADSQNASFGSTAPNQFSIRASGGVRLSDDTPELSFGSTTRQMLNLYSTTYGLGIQSGTLYQRANTRFSWFRGGTHSDTQNDPGTNGTVLMTLTSGGLTVNGTFVSASDRNAKEQFEPVNPGEILDKVMAMPLARWSYKADEGRSRHLGPMAQDFHAAFSLGADDKHIATVDADGVAFAAIQGLNQKVEGSSQRSEVRIQKLEAENEELRQRLEQLERIIKTNHGGKNED
jgi:hypothetical protein